MNGSCFQDPIGFTKFSFSPEFVPLLMDKELLHKIFASLCGIKQELYAKSYQVNGICETYLPTLKTHVVNLKRDANVLSRALQRWEVRGKLGSKTLYCARRSYWRPWNVGIRIIAWPKPPTFCEESLGKIKFRAFPKPVGPWILLLESVDYFGTSEHYWVVGKK